MRIGIDVRCLAEGKRTGVEEYTLALLEELFSKNQDDEYILFFNAWRKTLPETILRLTEAYPHVRLRAFRFPNKLFNLSLWYLNWPKLDQLIGGTDIFFLPNLNFAAVSGKTKLVVTAHDLSFELFPETFSLKQRLWHFCIDFRRLLRHADAVIAVSQSTKNDLIGYGISEEKITVIKNGIGPQFRVISRNDPELVVVKEKYALPYKYILYLGTFEPRKNILAILRSFEELSRLNDERFAKYALVLAGTRGWKCDAVFEAIKHSPYRDRILTPGFIDDRDKAALYNLATVFVYPSVYEGFGFPPLEAMACGVPTITSHSSSLPEIIGNAGILIDPYQPEELFLALKELLADQELRQTFQSEGIVRAAEFSWLQTGEKTLDLFRSLGRIFSA